MPDVLVFGEAAIVPATIAVTEAFKKFGIPSQIAMLVAVVVAILFTFGVRQTVSVEVAMDGILYGLTASGLYSGTKALAQG